MWQSNFYLVLKLTDEGTIFMEEGTNKLLFVQDLRKVIQFEIDKPYQNFKPHSHYNVDPLVINVKAKLAQGLINFLTKLS